MSPQISRTSRILRYTRIAFSAVCGVLCVLLVVLWVRSYFVVDIVDTPLTEIHLVGGAAIAFQQFHSNWDVECRAEQNPAEYRRQYESSRATTWYTVLTIIPFWSVLIALAILVAAPWLPIRRFSLRTLLIAITIMGLILGTIIYTIR